MTSLKHGIKQQQQKTQPKKTPQKEEHIHMNMQNDRKTISAITCNLCLNTKEKKKVHFKSPNWNVLQFLYGKNTFLI